MIDLFDLGSEGSTESAMYFCRKKIFSFSDDLMHGGIKDQQDRRYVSVGNRHREKLSKHACIVKTTVFLRVNPNTLVDSKISKVCNAMGRWRSLGGNSPRDTCHDAS